MSAAQALNIYKAIDFQLRIESGPDAGRIFRIHPPKITIGRDPSCDINLRDAKMSRVQCEITFGDHIIIKDKSSRRTSIVNGKPFTDHKIVPNDIVSFGDTRIRFIAKSKEKLPSIPGSKSAASGSVHRQGSTKPLSGSQPLKATKNRTPLFIIIGLLAAGFGYLFLTPESAKGTKEILTSSEELERQTQESRDYQQKLRDGYRDKLKTSQQNYQISVQQHYVRGFRDFQAENYGRAITAFGSAIAKDPNHPRARRYLVLSQQLLEEQIEKHIFNGEQFRSKLMYERCVGEFNKVLILLNRPRNPKYILANEHRNECLILQSGGSL